MLADLRGDLWTLYPLVRHALAPARGVPPAVPWETGLVDPDVGPVRLTGDLRAARGASELLVLVHGLGGQSTSLYCLRGAAVAARLGIASLCLSLRGADRSGEDFYNIALTADLHAALASPELAQYEAVYLLGYSMGGHVVLHYACEPADRRVRAVAAVCTPLDLRSSQLYIDRARAWAYRRHVLRGLIAIYAEVAARRPVPTPVEKVRAVRTIYDWDRLTIAPRYGFESPEHYYAELSLARRLEELQLPSLLVACENDPIVPPGTIRPHFGRAAGGRGALELLWRRRGGHLAFPSGVDLGLGGPRGLEAQLLTWLRGRR